MAGRLEGKVAVVTGASSGVGRAIVRAIAEEGARVGLIARSAKGLEAAASEVRERGGEALVLPLDVANARSSSTQLWARRNLRSRSLPLWGLGGAVLAAAYVLLSSRPRTVTG